MGRQAKVGHVECDDCTLIHLEKEEPGIHASIYCPNCREQIYKNITLISQSKTNIQIKRWENLAKMWTLLLTTNIHLT